MGWQGWLYLRRQCGCTGLSLALLWVSHSWIHTEGAEDSWACPSQDDHTNQTEPEKYTSSFKALSQNRVHCHFCPYSIVQCKSPGEAWYQWDRVTSLTYSHRKCKITRQRTCIFLTQGRLEELEEWSNLPFTSYCSLSYIYSSWQKTLFRSCNLSTQWVSSNVYFWKPFYKCIQGNYAWIFLLTGKIGWHFLITWYPSYFKCHFF